MRAADMLTHHSQERKTAHPMLKKRSKSVSSDNLLQHEEEDAPRGRTKERRADEIKAQPPRRRPRHRSLSPNRHYWRSPGLEDDSSESGEENSSRDRSKNKEEIHRRRGHSFPVHTEVRPSLLAPEAESQNYRGLLNLAGLLLFVTNARLVLENLLKYGLLMNFNGEIWALWKGTVCILSLIGLNGFVIIAYALEKYAAIKTNRILREGLRQGGGDNSPNKNDDESSNVDDSNTNNNTSKTNHSGGKRKKKISFSTNSVTFASAPSPSPRNSSRNSSRNAGISSTVPEKLIAFLHAINTTAACTVPVLLNAHFDADPISALVLLFMVIMLMMKLISYALVNKEMRQAVLSGKATKLQRYTFSTGLRYPQNITVGNIYYFIAAPTLCYQLEYPRTDRIRWTYVASMSTKMTFCFLLMLFMVEQYVVPILKNSLEPLDQMHMGHLMERLLKLSVPNLYIWLLMFYSFFHLWLNVLAEVLRFGDREFYKDWWNSTTLSEYWRTWNLPVHHWMVRHVYFPMRRAGFTANHAAFFIFFLSGVGHEVLVSIPCHTFQLWVFASFMGQVPLIWLTRNFMKGTKWGNVLFWFSFCMLGQPLCILLYTHIVYKHYSFFFFSFKT